MTETTNFFQAKWCTHSISPTPIPSLTEGGVGATQMRLGEHPSRTMFLHWEGDNFPGVRVRKTPFQPRLAQKSKKCVFSHIQKLNSENNAQSFVQKPSFFNKKKSENLKFQNGKKLEEDRPAVTIRRRVQGDGIANTEGKNQFP